MFWKAARQSARLKGERFEGAVIVEAIWRRSVANVSDEDREDVLPKILLDRHHLLKTRSCDGTDILDVTMLLGRKAPESNEKTAQKKELTAFVECTEKILNEKISLQFSAQQVYDFVTLVNDTNPLHQRKNPLVPGLLLLQKVIELVPQAQQVTMRFSLPVFADETVTIKICPEVKQGNGM